MLYRFISVINRNDVLYLYGMAQLATQKTIPHCGPEKVSTDSDCIRKLIEHTKNAFLSDK